MINNKLISYNNKNSIFLLFNSLFIEKIANKIIRTKVKHAFTIYLLFYINILFNFLL